MKTRKINLAAIIAGLSLASSAYASITVQFFPASDLNANTTVMDAALGITGFTIDTFEQTALIPGLNISLSGGVTPTTLTSLPNLLDESVCGPLTAGAWDGSHVASNLIANHLDSCNNPSGLAQMTVFNYAPGTTSFGIGLGNFQSPNSPEFPITNHELFVNGTDEGVIETLAGANWSPGIRVNSYLLITATGGSSITSVGFENNTASDFLEFDRLAVQPSSSSTSTPEPAAGWLLLAGTLAVSVRRFRRAAH